MCDTYLHARDDDALVVLVAADLAVEAIFLAVKNHRYHDECCRVELGGDMRVRYKRTAMLGPSGRVWSDGYVPTWVAD